MEYMPKVMNLELTTKCPLLCPQCYCSLNSGKDLAYETALFWVDQAAENKIGTINLSGGETLCYPYLYEVIGHAASRGINANVALSGFGFTDEVYRRLKDSGVNGIFVSLNGSSEQVNNKSRNGYFYAVEALKILKERKAENVSINWVMQKSNADDFPNIIELAEQYCVNQVVVISLKPNSKNELIEFPDIHQMNNICNFIRKYTGTVKIGVESCFSQMLALLGESFIFENTNVNEPIGCMAGRWNLSVNVDGDLSPCRHLNIFEKVNSLTDYWENSRTLNELRKIENNKRYPCLYCSYTLYCRHCIAVNYALHGALYIGYEGCPMFKRIEK